MPNQDLRDWVVAAAAARYPELSIEAESVDLKLIHAADRSVYRLDLPRSDTFLVLKIWLNDASGAPAKKTNSSVVDEFERTASAFKVASGAAESPPAIAEPLAVSRSRNAILLVGCDGDDFSKYLNALALTWPFHRAAIQRRFHFAGDWLARFHSLSQDIDDTGAHLDLRRTHLARMLSQCAAKAGDERFWDTVKSRFDGLVSDVQSVQVALLHGNYALRNLLVSDASISAIDFEDSRTDCIYYDLGQLIAEIRVRGFIPTFPRTLIDECHKGVVESYAATMDVQKELMNAYIGYHLVAFYYEHVRRNTKNPVVNYRRGHVKREIARWLKSTEKLSG